MTHPLVVPLGSAEAGVRLYSEGIVPVPPTVLLLAVFNAPLSGVLAGLLVALAYGLAVSGARPKATLGVLGTALLLSIWADAHPASGGCRH